MNNGYREIERKQPTLSIHTVYMYVLVVLYTMLLIEYMYMYMVSVVFILSKKKILE